jgi:hypothetical protein
MARASSVARDWGPDSAIRLSRCSRSYIPFYRLLPGAETSALPVVLRVTRELLDLNIRLLVLRYGKDRVVRALTTVRRELQEQFEQRPQGKEEKPTTSATSEHYISIKNTGSGSRQAPARQNGGRARLRVDHG